MSSCLLLKGRRRWRLAAANIGDEVITRRKGGCCLRRSDTLFGRVVSQSLCQLGKVCPGRLRGNVEAEDSHDAPVLLDSRVEALEGVSGRRWLSAFGESIDPRVRVILNLLACPNGSNVSAIKEAESMLDPASFSVGRFAIATPVFAPFLKQSIWGTACLEPED